MELLRVGGHFMTVTPASGQMGHGFYQFSPELWFRLLSPDNGFEMRRMVAVEYAPRARWFEVADPAVVRKRVEITNRYPVLLMVLAHKTANVFVLQSSPQQDHYFLLSRG